MRRTIVYSVGFALVAAAAIAAAPGAAHAQDIDTPIDAVASAGQPGTVVVIDSRRVVAESAIGRDIAARAEAAAGEWEQRIATAQAEIQTLMQQRANGALTLSEAALANLDAEIERRTIEGRRLEEDARRELQGLSVSLMQELNAQLGPTLESFAAERGFSLILDSGMAVETGVLYWSASIDVTEAFIAKINADAVAWKPVDDGAGRAIGRARVPSADSLQRAVMAAAPRIRY